MRLRGVFWLLLRLWAGLVLIALLAISILAVAGTGPVGPEIGLWVGLAGFLVIAFGMLLLVQMSRDEGP